MPHRGSLEQVKETSLTKRPKSSSTVKHNKDGWNEKEKDSCLMARFGLTLKHNEACIDLTVRSAKLDFGLFVGKTGVNGIVV